MRLLNIGFTRALKHDKWEAWIDLLRRLMDITLNDETNKFVWRLLHLVLYVNLMYAHYL
jgi:hypothetical protein